MNPMKKLLPALSLLLISAILVSSSTFAWFSMNTTVNATGMTVTAQAPTSLLISNTNATEGFGSTVALANDTTTPAAAFAPVAYSGVAASWYKLTAAGMASVNELGKPNAGTFTLVTDGSVSADFTNAKIGTDAVYEAADTHVYHDRVWLKVEGEKSQTVTATLAYKTQPVDTIKNAMHVVFVVNNTVIATVDMGTPATLTTAALATLTANATNGTQVDIYYFLSGNDDDCKNVNINADATMSLDITFTAANVA